MLTKILNLKYQTFECFPITAFLIDWLIDCFNVQPMHIYVGFVIHMPYGTIIDIRWLIYWRRRRFIRPVGPWGWPSPYLFMNR